MAAGTIVDLGEFIDRQKVTPALLRMLLVALAAQILEGFDLVNLPFVAPALVRDWHIERAAFGPVFSASLVGLMLGAFGFGAIGDRWGRKIATILAVGCFAVFSLVTVLATNINELLVLRFFTGLGIGGVMPTTIALVAEYSPRRVRGTMVTVMSCGLSLGAALGGLATQRLLGPYGWHSVFYVGGILPILLIPVLMVYLPESLRFVALQSHDQARIRTLLARMGAGQDLAPDTRFVLQEEVASGARLRALFSGGWAAATLMLWLTIFLNQVCVTFFNQWMPITLNEFGLTVAQAVTAAIGFQIGSLVAALIHGRLIDRFGFFRVLAVNYTMAAIFIVLLVSFGPDPAVVIGLASCAGFCIAGGQNMINGLSGAFYPTRVRATGSGWALGIGRSGGVVGPGLGGILLGMHLPVQEIFSILAIPALCAAGAILLMGHFARRNLGRATPILAH